MKKRRAGSRNRECLQLFHSFDFAEFLRNIAKQKLGSTVSCGGEKTKRKDNLHMVFSSLSLTSLFSGSSSEHQTKKNTLMQLGMHIVDHDPSKRPSDDLAFQTSTSSPQEIGEAEKKHRVSIWDETADL